MNLLIDVGNNYLKWAVMQDGRWDGGYRAAISGAERKLFDLCWGGLRAPGAVMVSNVRGQKFEDVLAKWCQERWRIRPKFLHPMDSTHGIVNNYLDPKQLGPDRWAALIGARTLAEGDLGVIDCGTAITIDALSAKNVFLGGAILPGLKLARNCLSKNTRGINESESDSIPVLGRSTAECVSSGVYYGLAGGVDRLVREIEKTLSHHLRLFITGGDAMRLKPLLKAQTVLEPELVLKGLSEVLTRL